LSCGLRSSRAAMPIPGAGWAFGLIVVPEDHKLFPAEFADGDRGSVLPVRVAQIIVSIRATS
jgi:hypothetical protein